MIAIIAGTTIAATFTPLESLISAAANADGDACVAADVNIVFDVIDVVDVDVDVDVDDSVEVGVIVDLNVLDVDVDIDIDVDDNVDVEIFEAPLDSLTEPPSDELLPAVVLALLVSILVEVLIVGEEAKPMNDTTVPDSIENLLYLH